MNAVIIGEELPAKYIVFDKSNQKTLKYSKNFLKKLYEMQLIEIENPMKLYQASI